jgi:SET domain-containing protein
MEQSIRACNRCKADRNVGGRCTRTTCKYGPFCWQHTKILRGVVVKKSTLKNAGLGLFALKSFRKGKKIIEYTGKLRRSADVERKWPGDTRAEYVEQIDDTNYYIDASKTNSGVARYANDAGYRGDRYRYRGERNNAHIVSYGPNQKGYQRHLWLVATRDIHPGDEIFLKYFGFYWNK